MKKKKKKKKKKTRSNYYFAERDNGERQNQIRNIVGRRFANGRRGRVDCAREREREREQKRGKKVTKYGNGGRGAAGTPWPKQTPAHRGHDGRMRAGIGNGKGRLRGNRAWRT
jgi:hypothetical protein